MKARLDRTTNICQHNVCTKAPERMCNDETGKKLVSVRQLNINKGDEANPEYRGRLVSREIKTDTRQDPF